MRLSESKIKEAILHPDAEIRERAIRYFDRSFSHDTSVVSLVIQAVERYGREGAYNLIGGCTDLAHTDETISWVIEELNRDDADQYENYAFNLTRVLCDADPALLVHRDSQIIEARHFLASYRDTFLERLELLSWDEAACWRELEGICEAGKDKDDTKDVELDRASHVLEALARMGGPQCEERILAILSQQIVSFDNNPMKWMEPLMVGLAGLMRLKSAVPLIIKKLHEDDDVLAPKCRAALVRIGTAFVVEAVAEQFPSAKRHFRIYGTGVFEDIHADLSVEMCLAFLPQEEDCTVKRDLAHASLSQFAYEAIEPVRQLLLVQPHKGEWRHLRNHLVLTCKIMGERFPEYQQWTADGEREREAHKQKMEELKDDPKAMMLWAFQQLKEMAEDYQSEREEPTKESPPMSQVPPAKLKSGDAAASSFASGNPARNVGRNDPCPCGSGKKFKKCCMRKQGI